MDLNDKTWREIQSPSGSGASWPSPRYFSSGLVAPAEYTRSGSSEFWLFGGRSTSDFDELWIFNLETYIWTLERGGLSDNDIYRPASRSGMNIASRWGKKLLVYGGSSVGAQTEFADVWMYDFEVQEWELVNAGVDGPGKRTDHVSNVINVNGRDVMIVYGGIRDNTGLGDEITLSDIWSLDLVTKVWSQLSLSPVIPLTRQSAVAESNTIWNYGGFTSYTSQNGKPSGSISNQVVAMEFSNPNSNMWLQPTIATNSVPGARYDHTADVWRGSMLIYGGRYLNQLKASNMWSMDLQGTDLEAITPETEQDVVPTFSLLHVLLALSIMMCCMCIFMWVIRSRLNTQANQSTEMNEPWNPDQGAGGLSNEEMLRLPPLKRFKSSDTESGTYSFEILNSPTSIKGINITPKQESVGSATTAEDDDYQHGKCCAICIDSFGNGDIVRELPCSHEFHADCVDQWLKTTPLCPMCKRSMREATETPENENERGDRNEAITDTGMATDVESGGSTTASAIEVGQVSHDATTRLFMILPPMLSNIFVR